MITVDGRCPCEECTRRTKRTYHMAGVCLNCGAADLLMVFRVGDNTRRLNCPVCGNRHTVSAQRLATTSEVSTLEAQP